MLANIVTHYAWWILALLLISAEVLAPGFFLLWIGIAAALMALLLLLFPGLSALTQAVLFVLLAFLSVFAYMRLLRPALEHGDEQPLLNRRAEQLIGRRFTLATAIEHGRGKARVGDSLWMVEGPDLPLDSTVEVVAVDGSTLKVKAVS